MHDIADRNNRPGKQSTDPEIGSEAWVKRGNNDQKRTAEYLFPSSLKDLWKDKNASNRPEYTDNCV
jgi:hypothetical protein